VIAKTASHSEDPVWFVTGCSRGVARCLAERLAKSAVRGVVTARPKDSLADIVAVEDSRLFAAEVDVREKASVRAAADLALATFGRIDIVVNNAGPNVVGALEGVTDDEIDLVLATNLDYVAEKLPAVHDHLDRALRTYCRSPRSPRRSVPISGLTTAPSGSTRRSVAAPTRSGYFPTAGRS
jgi:NAD(P)-dependent dehydrogenase (short-subunit alcohol dehydrogenase family)